jgi:hypothetical protein
VVWKKRLVRRVMLEWREIGSGDDGY